jgi:hypothetical protein
MNNTEIFNNSIETGLRSLIILEAVNPYSLDLQRLIYFDYLTVHTGDIENGPTSLHPAVPNRSGELFVRREKIEEGLNLFLKKRFIEKIFTKNGIEYRLSDNANLLLDILEEEYTLTMKKNAMWVVNKFIDMNNTQLKNYITNNIDKWGGEFMYCNIEDEIND